MLTPISQGAGAPKQIVVTSSTAGQVMYTVPAGKTFTGHFFTTTTSPAISINGVALYFTGTELKPVTLLAGTVVACGANATIYLVGVEQ